MSAFYQRDDCRFCGCKRLDLYLDLGDQPPSNAFLKPSEIDKEVRYPLQVFLCRECGLSQLRGVVSSTMLFDEYQYQSSTSKALVRHYESLIPQLLDRFSVSPGDAVLDIGCNDGIMLNAYPPSLKCIGVEPSQIAELARDRGHRVYGSFFTAALAGLIVGEQGPMKIVTATNVFAHIDDIHDVVVGIHRLLAPDGIFVIEAPYVVDMVDKNSFDTIYHEHLCYLGLTPLLRLMEGHDMEIFDVERISVGASGPAIRVFCQRRDGAWPRNPRAAELLAEESRWGIRALGPYKGFADRVGEIKTELLNLLDGLRAKGLRVGAYGAPAKGNTLLNTFGLGPDRITEGVAEVSPVKQGKLTPGTHLPVISEEEFLRRMPEYALLLTWNYLDFLLRESSYIKRGGRFIVPFPRPVIHQPR